MFEIIFTKRHIVKPHISGAKNETKVHLKLFVSLYIDIQVVEQGKCNKKNIITHIAVVTVQPFEINRLYISLKFPASLKIPEPLYNIIIIGITISFAGKPSINAVNITPSIPNILANGFRKSVTYEIILALPIFIFANIHIISPAGTETATALPNIDMVLSNILRIITLIICGFLYGGSSSANDEFSPFSNVFESIFDITKVIIMPSIITPSKMRSVNIEATALFEFLTKKIVISAIKAGNRPLQGTNEFVIIAINLSRGESIILHPVTPQALHPNPIHIVYIILYMN